MGEVTLVHDHDLMREVAVKRQLDGAPDDRFVREIRTLGRLEHPNIVPVHDVGREADGRLFFVMKKVEGETLQRVIERLRDRDPSYVERFPFERRVEIVVGILHALAHAHAAGILHRDVKPENVMLGRHGEVHPVDWGIAVPFAPSVRPTTEEPVGLVVGTPSFMSPEQARGENDRIDARSDLYSVGALMHELLTLRHYLGDEHDPAKVVAKVAAEGWTNTLLDWHRPGPGPMPPMELYHFVRKAIAFRRERRFASADEMIAELHRIFEGRIRVQCPITLVKSGARRAGRFVDRFPWTAFILAATTSGLAAWGIVRTALDLI
jgi:serine/threonine-protein kinase